MVVVGAAAFFVDSVVAAGRVVEAFDVSVERLIEDGPEPTVDFFTGALGAASDAFLLADDFEPELEAPDCFAFEGFASDDVEPEPDDEPPDGFELP